jgi:L-gulono-1,4-lactone dehydrogenase
VTTRNEIPAEEYRRDRRRTRNWLVELTARLWLTPKLINLVVGIRPSISPFLLHLALKNIANPDYVNVSYRVLNIGAANYLPSYSSEIGVAIDERGLHLRAVDEVVKVAARHRELGEVYQSSPISLRFVKASDAYMSMMEGRDTMMIELIMLTHSEGGMELLADYEDALYETVEGRPHWGQVNWVTRDRIAHLYPHFDDWLDVHGRLNATGVFDSPFSRRVGISGAGGVPR